MYIKKVFENNNSISEQKEDIEDIFLEYMDIKLDTGDDYDEFVIQERDKCFLLNIHDIQSDDVLTTLDEYYTLYDQKKKSLETFRKLGTCLKRLDYAGFKWNIEYEKDSRCYLLEIFYKDEEISFIDAFSDEYPHSIDASIIRKIFKEKYNISVDWCKYKDGYFHIMPNKKITGAHRSFKDLEKIIDKNGKKMFRDFMLLGNEICFRR